VSGRRYALLAVAIVWLGASLLRFATLGRQSLWIDEAYSWTAASRATAARLMADDETTVDRVHPPTYYFLLRQTLKVLPETEFGVRALSAACSAAALGLLALFAWRWFGPLAALVTTLLAAISGFELFFAQEARMYALFALCWLLASGALVDAWRGSWRGAAVWAAANALLPAIQYVGVLPATTHVALVAVLLLGPRLERRVRVLLLAGAMASLFTCGLAAAAALGAVGNAGGSAAATAVDLWRAVGVWTIGPGAAARSFPGHGLALDWPPLLVHGVPALALAVVAGALVRWRRPDVFVPVVSGLLPVLVLWSVAAFGPPVWALKPLVAPALLFLLTLGAGLAALDQAGRRAAALGLLAILTAAALVALRPFFPTWVKSEARAAARVLPEQLGPDEALWLGQYPRELANFYRRDLPRALGAQPRRPAAPLRSYAAGSAERAFVACDSIGAQTTLYLFPAGLGGRSPTSGPPCLRSARLRTFDGTRWRPLGAGRRASP
jgi:hypothetical protein